MDFLHRDALYDPYCSVDEIITRKDVGDWMRGYVLGIDGSDRDDILREDHLDDRRVMSVPTLFESARSIDELDGGFHAIEDLSDE